MSYKNLNVNRNHIENYIKQYCDSELENSTVVLKKSNSQGKQLQYEVSVSNKNILFEVFYVKDGTTTLNYKIGKSQDDSHKIAQYIVEHGVIDSRISCTESISGITNDTLNLLLEYLSEEFESLLIEEKIIEHGIQKALSIKTGEKVYFNYYNTNTLTIQGKPLALYQSIITFLIDYGFINSGTVIQSSSSSFEIEMNETEILSELESKIPQAFIHIQDNSKALLVSGVMLSKININIPDYSSFVSPLFRSIEGIMKNILLTCGIIINRSFSIFDKNETEQYVIQDAHKRTINCTKKVKAIEDLYNYWSRNRHSISHADALDISTRIMNDKTEVIAIYNDALVQINEAYNTILN